VTVVNLFSKRQKKLRGEVPDIYTYDIIPEPLRVQIVHIWDDAMGNDLEYRHQHDYGGKVFQACKYITNTLCREYGFFELPSAKKVYEQIRNYRSELVRFVLQEQDSSKVIDAIELSFKIIDVYTRDTHYLNRNENPSKRADAAIAELNTRFQEHGIGYQFTDGEIIRVESQLIHAEVVKPALALLHGTEYAGAQAEFLKAHEHYRHGRAKEALNECLKALESTMKAICEKHGWKYQPNDTCNTLINTCIENKLIPEFWTQQFTSLRSTLGGVSTGRNKLGGHGQGSAVVEVPMHIVAYVLHMTAAAIVFVAQSESTLK
jgi:hypothetical protein